MKARLIGAIAGGLLGASFGAGTGIVVGGRGGLGLAGELTFTLFGALWGYSASPDLVCWWRLRK